MREHTAAKNGGRQSAGARIAPAERVWGEPELLVKVKEPNERECGLMREGQTLFTYLHLAAAPALTRRLQQLGIRAIAYETVQLDDGAGTWEEECHVVVSSVGFLNVPRYPDWPGLDEFEGPSPNSGVRFNEAFGVLALTLYPGGYDWEFLTPPGSTQFTDTGSGVCT